MYHFFSNFSNCWVLFDKEVIKLMEKYLFFWEIRRWDEEFIMNRDVLHLLLYLVNFFTFSPSKDFVPWKKKKKKVRENFAISHNLFYNFSHKSISFAIFFNMLPMGLCLRSVETLSNFRVLLFGYVLWTSTYISLSLLNNLQLFMNYIW